MKRRLFAALLVAATLPLAAQTATARVDPQQGKAQVKEDKVKAEGAVTDKERARHAKAKNKQGKKIAKAKQDKQPKDRKQAAPAG